MPPLIPSEPVQGAAFIYFNTKGISVLDPTQGIGTGFCFEIRLFLRFRFRNGINEIAQFFYCITIFPGLDKQSA